MSARPEFLLFEDIVAEAAQRGYGIDVARGVWKMRYHTECPFHAASASATMLAPDVRVNLEIAGRVACTKPLSLAPTASEPLASHPPSPIAQKSPLPTALLPSSPPVVARPSSTNSLKSPLPPLAIDVCRIDFETRSRADLAECGAARYAEDPSTVVLCLSYKFAEYDEMLWTPADGDCPPVIARHIADGGIVEAHGAEFEQCIWVSVCVARMGWPPIPEAQWRDSMATCAAFAIPLSLADATAAMAAPIRKDDDGHKVMLKLCKPRKPSKANPSEWHDDPGLFSKLYAYCRQDVNAEHGLSTMLPPLSDYEERVWQASNTINRRGIYVDKEGVEAAMRMVALARVDYNNQLVRATGGVLSGDSIGSWQVVLPWLKGRGVHLPNYQKLTLREALKTDMPDDARRVIEIRLALGQTSTAKYPAMLAWRCSDGRARGLFTYHGAGPGRWSGRGPQVQNIAKGKFTEAEVDACFHDMARLSFDDFQFMWGDPMRAASYCIRGALCAAPGKTLIAGDLNTIEARVLCWLAGQMDALEAFRRGEDVHAQMAALIFLVDVGAVNRKTQRPLGKKCKLGCGYGMGPEKFFETCEHDPDFREANFVVTMEQAAAAVKAYRDSHPQVVRLWYALEAAAIGAVRSGTVTAVSEGRIKFKMQGEHLKMRLPSGRLVCMPFAQVQPRKTPWGEWKDSVTFMGTDSVTHQWTRQAAYGGMLSNYAAQGAARDLLAGAMLRAEERGFPVVLHAHDELVSEINDDDARSVDEYCSLLCELPEWAAGLPVTAEGWRGVRYRK